jgi:hypothetical protein
VTFRDANEVRLLRFFSDGAFSGPSAPARPYLTVDPTAAPIFTNTLGTDSRGIAVDGSERQQAEVACLDEAAGEARAAACAMERDCPSVEDPNSDECVTACIALREVECLRAAASIPLRVYVANRTPPSLVIGRTRPQNTVTSADDLPSFFRSIPLTAGPSRVVVGDVINPAGERERRVFVVCFDSRLVFIYDPFRDVVEAEVLTGRGPHALAIDAERGLAYLGHFTDSYFGVMSLDQRHPKTYGTLIATIGVPTPPRASK